MSASPPGRYTGSRSPSPGQDENRPRSMSQERPRRQARSPSRPAHSKDTRYSLYVSGLSPKVTEDDLYEHFAKEGKVRCMCRHGSVANLLATLPFDVWHVPEYSITSNKDLLLKNSGRDSCMHLPGSEAGCCTTVSASDTSCVF